MSSFSHTQFDLLGPLLRGLWRPPTSPSLCDPPKAARSRREQHAGQYACPGTGPLPNTDDGYAA